ncbi:hypothetical protein EST38_g9679 [Candolleomyces aberdarensis]|uniref:JmjC domain-containing protein n=1 Tax=Candolleomyces aberdarensis TaxID=2316362 RepID=A0A4Q2DA10_9AGAR|nr:hypothetical protein EST38_g9679 [Candolleomyces aberdarensis]
MTYGSFTFAGKCVPYEVIESGNDPTGIGRLGDLHFNTVTGVPWVFTSIGWTTADLRRSANGMPKQTHPVALGDRRFSVILKDWKSRNFWYTDNGREEVESWMRMQAAIPVAATGVPSGSLPTAIPAAALNVQSGSSPVPSWSGPSVAAHPSNSWIVNLLQEWTTGPPALVEIQLQRGVAILQALLAFNTPITRLDSSTSTSATCESFGIARRRGCPPTQLLAINDLLAEPDITYSDSFSNMVEDDVSAADFWNVQSLLSNRTPLDRSGRLLAAFDIPATEAGMLSCRYDPPFNIGKGSVVSSLTNAWTLPGAITHPHVDGIACAMHMIHWRGKKLWLLWPATPFNLKLIEHTMTTSSHLDTTLDLIRWLEGLELLFLTQEEYFEYSFCLRPNTIHCCLSFTESCHLGMPVRDIRYLDEMEVVMDWVDDWFRNRLFPNTVICKKEHRQVVEKFLDAVKRWHEVKRQPFDKVLKARLGKVLDDATLLIDNVPVSFFA